MCKIELMEIYIVKLHWLNITEALKNRWTYKKNTENMESYFNTCLVLLTNILGDSLMTT